MISICLKKKTSNDLIDIDIIIIPDYCVNYTMNAAQSVFFHAAITGMRLIKKKIPSKS